MCKGKENPGAVRGEKIIGIDTREQNGDYIKSRFDAIGIQSDIITLPYSSGCDYLIVNTHGSCGIQRKSAMKELVNQMDDLAHDILPRLSSFTDNPVLLVEEDFTIGEMGNLFRKDSSAKLWIETGVHSSSYYGFLESCRMKGIDVVCTRNLDQSVWYMAAMHGYLGHNHYPKHQKLYKPYQQALGMLCCVPGIGLKKAEKILGRNSIEDLVNADKADGLTEKQLKKVQMVLRWK